jgi:hypothetical protein
MFYERFLFPRALALGRAFPDIFLEAVFRDAIFLDAIFLDAVFLDAVFLDAVFLPPRPDAVLRALFPALFFFGRAIAVVALTADRAMVIVLSTASPAARRAAAVAAVMPVFSAA